MTQAGRAVIDQQEGTEAGASGDDLGAPFSLSALSKGVLTHHQQAGGSMACGHRAPSGGNGAGTVPSSAFPCQYIQQTPTVACASDAAAPITRGLGAFGHQQAAQGIYLCIACYYYQLL